MNLIYVEKLLICSQHNSLFYTLSLKYIVSHFKLKVGAPSLNDVGDLNDDFVRPRLINESHSLATVSSSNENRRFVRRLPWERRDENGSIMFVQ